MCVFVSGNVQHRNANFSCLERSHRIHWT